MKKEYKPLNMLMNGRYAVLYKGLTPDVQADVLKRMQELITEEKEYEDKGNYGHLCNILPTIAIDEVLQKHGSSPEEAFDLLSTHMWAALTPGVYQKMSKLPFFVPLMKKIVPLGFKHGSGKGWQYVWHFDEDGADEFHFECTECLYRHEFGKRNLLERFGRMFCYSDIINYGNLHNIDFKRTQTLCQGGQKCDFCFIKHKKGEVWQRSESV